MLFFLQKQACIHVQTAIKKLAQSEIGLQLSLVF